GAGTVAVVMADFDVMVDSTPSMMRSRLACELDSWLMVPLSVSPVSMSMSMPSKLNCFRIGTTVAMNRSATVLELRSMPAVAPPIDMRIVAPFALAWHISAGVATFTVASMPSCHSTVPSDRLTGYPPLVVVGRGLARPEFDDAAVGGGVAPDVHALAGRYPGDRAVAVQLPLLAGRPAAGAHHEKGAVASTASGGGQAALGHAQF